MAAIGPIRRLNQEDAESLMRIVLSVIIGLVIYRKFDLLSIIHLLSSALA